MKHLLSNLQLLKLPAGVILISLCCACQSTEKKSEKELVIPSAEVIRVMNRYADSLMAISGVTGVSVGADEDGLPLIMILIREESAELRALLPDSLEGYPVQVNVSGEIRPLQGN